MKNRARIKEIEDAAKRAKKKGASLIFMIKAFLVMEGIAEEEALWPIEKRFEERMG